MYVHMYRSEVESRHIVASFPGLLCTHEKKQTNEVKQVCGGRPGNKVRCMYLYGYVSGHTVGGADRRGLWLWGKSLQVQIL